MGTNSELQRATKFVESAAKIGWFSAYDGVLLLRTSLAGEVLVSSLCQEEGTSNQDLIRRMDMQGNVLFDCVGAYFLLQPATIFTMQLPHCNILQSGQFAITLIQIPIPNRRNSQQILFDKPALIP